MFSTKLLFYYDILASHSLETNPEPHFHLWKTTLTISGTPVRGKLVDLPTLESLVKETLVKLENTYLNENKFLLPEAQEFPTCEFMGASIFTLLNRNVFSRLRDQNPSLQLLSVQVTLCDPTTQKVFGSAITEMAPESLKN